MPPTARRGLIAVAALAPLALAPPEAARSQVRSGLEVLLRDSLHVVRDKRVGLITNHTGRDGEGRRNVDLLVARGVRVVALFGPEHGIAGVERAGERVGFGRDSATGLPVYSLYGETRVPTPEMLRDVDVLLYDIQDVGARVYTFVWTMALAAEAAGRLGIPFLVLDRPNPIRADVVEGGVLELPHRSFVGQYDVALRYGLTPGELLRFLAGTGRVSARAGVMPMAGYRRAMWYSETGLPWINTSPNIRDEETALLYPGTVFFEATNLSEGRGTDAPLKQVGAPWLADAAEIAAEMNGRAIPGIRFEAGSATVAPGEKHGGATIPVVRLRVVDRDRAEPVAAAAWLMRAIYRRHPTDWRWRGNGIERLAGTAQLRAAVEQDAVEVLLARWRDESRAFLASTRAYRLY
jgi:uncharacterized protein YbbC (DUF1343 family)